eukprot:CAMPEP_0168531718 /NCGR_PEP_ID=MMETSP0405-20121227/15685_1 /TAXON_ID=498012 /ORGANISM="Trichosphaerium sp, Strain Am-I-7 wt" /LENGTH=329 /DNA_ID=CAMNT_0008556715 /DNA_START=120 /DNA_END=1110 /DNA_ORIENTATION=-
MTVERLVNFITTNTPIQIIAVIDHTSNAESVGLSLPPLKVLALSNANVGTGYMQLDQRYAIEAPLRICIWEDAGGQVHVMYNGFEHLRQRFCIDADISLPQTIFNAITNGATGRDNTTIPPPPLGNCDPSDLDFAGLVIKESQNSVPVTVNELINAFEGTPIRVILNFDHQANAFNSGLALRPTTVVWFGNPVLGTPVMNSNLRAGMDLPQKVLVYEDEDGKVYLAYNNPNYIRDRYDIQDQSEIFTTFVNVLNRFTDIATTESSPSICVTPLFDLQTTFAGATLYFVHAKGGILCVLESFHSVVSCTEAKGAQYGQHNKGKSAFVTSN